MTTENQHVDKPVSLVVMCSKGLTGPTALVPSPLSQASLLALGGKDSKWHKVGPASIANQSPEESPTVTAGPDEASSHTSSVHLLMICTS